MGVPSTLHSCLCSQASGMQMTSRNWASLWCATCLVSPFLIAPQRLALRKQMAYCISMEVTSVSVPWNCHPSHEPEGPLGLSGHTFCWAFVLFSFVLIQAAFPTWRK